MEHLLNIDAPSIPPHVQLLGSQLLLHQQLMKMKLLVLQHRLRIQLPFKERIPPNSQQLLKQPHLLFILISLSLIMLFTCYSMLPASKESKENPTHGQSGLSLLSCIMAGWNTKTNIHFFWLLSSIWL